MIFFCCGRYNFYTSKLSDYMSSNFSSDESKEYVAKHLIDRKHHRLKIVNDHNTVLHLTIRHGGLTALRNLLDILNKNPDLQPHYLTSEICRKDDRGDTALYSLISCKEYLHNGRIKERDDTNNLQECFPLLLPDKEALQAIFLEESKINTHWTFLHNVARWCPPNNFKKIIEYLAILDKNILTKMLNTCKSSSDGKWAVTATPLDLAISWQSAETVEWLRDFLLYQNINIIIPEELIFSDDEPTPKSSMRSKIM